MTGYMLMGASDVRRHIVELVQLLASSEQQLAYQRDVPIANVPAELVCMWFDDLYHPQWDLFVEAFSETERNRLATFHRFYDARVEQLPNSLEEMHQSVVWRDVMSEAKQVLNDLGWPAGG